MRTGSLVRLTSALEIHGFITEAYYCGDKSIDPANDYVYIQKLDIGLVVDDLIEEEEEHQLLVIFNEKIVRADCRLLRRVK